MKNSIKTVFIAALAALFFQCKNEPAANGEMPAEKKETEASGDQVHLTTAQVKQAGIATGSFVMKPLSAQLSVVAGLEVAVEDAATVSAYTDGVLRDLRVSLNQKVQRGAVVAVMYKPDLIELQQQFLENRDQLTFLQAEFDRYQKLQHADATASKNFTKASSDLNAARTTNGVLEARLKEYNIAAESLTTSNLKTNIVLTAPVSGTVTKVMANTGTALTPGTPVCAITDFSKLHPVLHVFEKNIAQVQIGQAVEINFPGQSEVYKAKVTAIERTVEPERKTIRVHTQVQQSMPAFFGEGAYMEARILLDSGAGTSALPQEAVVREGEGDFIFVEKSSAESGTVFQKVPVKAGASAGGFVAVQPGVTLSPDAKIVVKGAYYVSAQGAGVSAE